MMFYPLFFPFIPTTNEKPVTIYSILNSYVNYDAEKYTKISNLANVGRTIIFDFDYPLSNQITKEDFETQILNHYMMRRIGFETVTAFKIALNAKLNEIMPTYNKLFDVLNNWNIFNDGETIDRRYTSNANNTSNIDSTGNVDVVSDRRYSDTPQNKLENIKDGSYVSEYNYDSNNNYTQTNTSSSGNNNINDVEITKRSPHDKMYVYKELLNEKNNIMKSIYKELDNLFYDIIS